MPAPGIPSWPSGSRSARATSRWSYRQFRDEAVRYAHFLLRRLGPIDDKRPGHVAMLLENQPQLLALYGGCGFAGLTLFGVNTGLRGETLAGVINQSRARVLVVGERFLPEVERIRSKLAARRAGEPARAARAGRRGARRGRSRGMPRRRSGQARGVARHAGREGGPREQPDGDLHLGHHRPAQGHQQQPLQVPGDRSHRLAQLGLGPDDVGYACMPLFHSNAIFLGFQPAFHVGGTLSMRERFSASSFVPDVLRYGVSYWNYVGEPVHYILAAIEKEYGGDEARILREIANNPRNRLRYALGNGAAPPDIDRFMRWFALEDMLELYGSTEAAISTFRKKTDPRGSVGEITDPNVKILNESGRRVSAGESRPGRQDPQLRRGGGRDLPRGARHGALPGLLREPGGQLGEVPRQRLPLGGSRAHRRDAAGSASSTSTDAPTTGSGRTARTSPRRRWRGCSRSTRT